MSADRLLLLEKYKAFLRCGASAEFLEGTTYAGKTTVGFSNLSLSVQNHLKSFISWQPRIPVLLRKTSSTRTLVSWMISVF